MTGRLALKRCDTTGGTNLFWVGIGKVDRNTFDQTLQRTLAIQGATQPIELTDRLWWVCRLLAGDYIPQQRREGGMSLYQVFGQGRPKPERRSRVAVRNIH